MKLETLQACSILGGLSKKKETKHFANLLKILETPLLPKSASLPLRRE